MPRKKEAAIQPKVGFVSLGCPKALVDSEQILTRLRAEGYDIVPDYEGADLVVVNTCGFIDAAVAESLDAIGEALTENGRVIVTGCLGAKEDVVLAAHPQVLAVTGPHATEQVMQEVHRHLPKPHDPFEDLVPPQGIKLTPRHYAYLKISEGCNHRCRYCAIPVIRGNLRSRPFDAIIEDAKRLIGSGIKELNLIAQDLAAYGTDQGDNTSKFLDLLQALAALDGDFRLRMLYIHPDAFPAELPALVAATPKIIPYFDIPFQHAHPNVLRPMGRMGDRETYLELVASIRAVVPDATLRSTFMLGFTGETPETVMELQRFVKEAQLDWVGSFVYSREEDTPAYKDRTAAEHKTISKRAVKWQKELEAIQEPITTQRLQRFVGTEQNVLIEELVEGEDLAIGRTPHQAPEVDGLTVVMGRNLVPGEVVRCGISRVNGIDLEAIPVGSEGLR